VDSLLASLQQELDAQDSGTDPAAESGPVGSSLPSPGPVAQVPPLPDPPAPPLPGEAPAQCISEPALPPQFASLGGRLTARLFRPLIDWVAQESAQSRALIVAERERLAEYERRLTGYQQHLVAVVHQHREAIDCAMAAAAAAAGRQQQTAIRNASVLRAQILQLGNAFRFLFPPREVFVRGVRPGRDVPEPDAVPTGGRGEE
jgi:hypothetical protein